MMAQLHARTTLSDRQIRGMLALLQRHFEGVTAERFEHDLNGKNWAILLTNEAGRLVGFSTLHFQVITYRGREESLLYSGDTIMDPEGWNSTILSRAWIEAAYRLHERLGRGPLWWLLITSGFRTYRLLPVFWQRFFPRWDRETPALTRDRLDTFADKRFGRSYDPGTGIVRLPHPQRLRQHLCGIPASRLRNRHVAYFAERNPGHAEGDELACLTSLEESNLTTAGRRIVEAIRRQPALSVTLP